MATFNSIESVSDSETDQELSQARNLSETRQILDDTEAGAILPTNRCGCCFTLKTALIGILLTLGMAVTFVLILDLVIMEVERGTEEKYYNENVANYKDEDDESVNPRLERAFVLNGRTDTDTISQFVSIPDPWSLAHVKLSNVEVNPAQLSNSLKYTELKSLTLLNVTIFGRMDQPDIIPNLPKLRYYTLQLNQPIGPKEILRMKNKNCVLSDLTSALTATTFQDKDCLASLIFFRKSGSRAYYDYGRSFDITRVYNFNTTIRVTLFGLHLFALDMKEGELTSVFNYSEEILKNLLRDNPSFFQLRKLNLRTCPLTLLSLEQFAGQLTQLHLGSVNFSDTETKLFSSTLGKFTQLNRFYIMGRGNNYPIEMDSIDLVDITTNVRELRLGFVELDYRNNITLLNTKFVLNHLYLHDIGIKNPDIIGKFHQIFDSKRVFFDGANLGRIPFSRYEFWLNVMKMPTIEYVLFDDSGLIPAIFARTLPNSSQFLTPAINATIQSKLTELDVKIDISKPFLLRKNNVTGKWDGRNYDVRNEKDKLKLYVDGGNVDETFINIDTFLNLKFPSRDLEISLQ